MSSSIFAIDPGSKESAYVHWKPGAAPVEFAKVPNGSLLEVIERCPVDDVQIVIEKITLYQRADENIHDTLLWSGRFYQVFAQRGVEPELMPRGQVKKLLLPSLSSSDRNDSTVKHWLKDTFAKDVPNHGKGTKKEPGFFYGFSADVWQAFALAVAFNMQSEAA